MSSVGRLTPYTTAHAYAWSILRNYQKAGDVCGELALLCDCPRAAIVDSADDDYMRGSDVLSSQVRLKELHVALHVIAF